MSPDGETLLQTQRPRPLSELLDRWYTRRLLRRAGAHVAQRGHAMAVFANDLIGIDINRDGVYERDELELLFAFLEPLRAEFARGTALDIGANIGNHALWFAPRFARLHAFEPNPDTFELLRFNTRHAPHVQTHCLGLGEQAGQFELVEHAGNLGGASLRIAPGEGGRSVSIEIQRLDDMALPLQGLCFVKIDVEGFEPDVIRGARAMLRQYQPLVVLEQHAQEFRDDGKTPAIEALAALGYRFAWQQPQPAPRSWALRRWFDVCEAVSGRPLRIVTADQVQRCHHSMIIAIPPRFWPALAHGAVRG